MRVIKLIPKAKDLPKLPVRDHFPAKEIEKICKANAMNRKLQKRKEPT